MRIRSIKPDFWQLEDLAALPADAILLAIGLNNLADDEGYFNANPKLVQAALFPLRDSSLNIHGMLTQLADIKRIDLREKDGKRYGRINTWLDEQVINRPRESELKPLFENALSSSTTDHGTFSESSLIIHPGREGKGKEGKGKEGSAQTRRDSVGISLESQSGIIQQRMTAINECKGRKPSTRWSSKEWSAFKAAGLDTCEHDTFFEQANPVRAYYTATIAQLRAHWGNTGEKADADYRRRDLLTLLTNWSGEVDRAQAYCDFQSKIDVSRESGRL